MVRQFRIIGLNTGNEYSLNDFNKYLITLPENLGFEYKNNFMNVGNQRLRVSQERVYKAFKGTIEVSGNTRDEWEKNYNELRDFIAKNKNKGFKLYYKNRQNNERYIICDLKLFEKTEKSNYAILVPIELEPRSLWLTDVTINSKAEEQKIDKSVMAFMEDNYFAGEYRYNYGFYEDETGDYVTKFYAKQVGTATLVNNSDEETSIIITIYGRCENPHFILFDSSGKPVQEGRIYVTLAEGEKLILNSNPEELSIKEYIKVGGEVKEYNITNDIDMSLKNFITIPVGTFTIKFNDTDSSNVIKADIEFNNRYLGG